jgi:NAD(P)-dependent dehydrogenase (short-subunit alcohol dehydrogenase family)
MPSLGFNLDDKVAIVTGGTSGIGQAVAAALLDAGASVLVGSRSEEKIAAAREQLAEGRDASKLLATRLDIAETSTFETAMAEAVDTFGRVDILVNCAGVNLKKPTLEVSDEEHRFVMEVDYFGPFRACQRFAAQVASQNQLTCGEPTPDDASRRIGQAGFGGVIVNVCSVTSFLALSEVTTYAGAKSALLGLTRQLAVEWPRMFGIRVNAIAPGFIPAEQNLEILKSGDRGRRILENTPMQRFGTPAEIAGSVVFLCSPAGRFINGECINIDGGFMTHGVSDAEPRDEA